MTNAQENQQDKAEREQRFREALALQEIEGNPLTADEIAMFEMFEREGWDEERCIAFIIEKTERETRARLAAE